MSIKDSEKACKACSPLMGCFPSGASPVCLLCPNVASSSWTPRCAASLAPGPQPGLEGRLPADSQPYPDTSLALARTLRLGWPAHPGLEGAHASPSSGQQRCQQFLVWFSQAESGCCHGCCPAQNRICHPSGQEGRVEPHWLRSAPGPSVWSLWGGLLSLLPAMLFLLCVAAVAIQSRPRIAAFFEAQSHRTTALKGSRGCKGI